MRGPFERLKYDLRRGWECPVCHRKEKTDFLITSRFCNCQQKKEGGALVSMKLSEDGVRRVWTSPAMLVAQEARRQRLAAAELLPQEATPAEAVPEVPAAEPITPPEEIAADQPADREME